MPLASITGAVPQMPLQARGDSGGELTHSIGGMGCVCCVSQGGGAVLVSSGKAAFIDCTFIENIARYDVSVPRRCRLSPPRSVGVGGGAAAAAS